MRHLRFGLLVVALVAMQSSFAAAQDAGVAEPGADAPSTDAADVGAADLVAFMIGVVGHDLWTHIAVIAHHTHAL